MLAALDDCAAYLSRVAESVAVIAAHQPSKAIRQELRRILAARDGAREALIAARAAHHERMKKEQRP